MPWLLAALASYLLLAVVVVVDAVLLRSAFPDPKLYAFSVGMLGLLILALTPFLGFPVPPMDTLALALGSGVASLFGILTFYSGIQRHEASRMAPATGGLLPVFTVALGALAASETRIVDWVQGAGIVLLALGTFAITARRSAALSLKAFGTAALAAFLFSFLFVGSKIVYLRVPFWTGFLWVTVGIGCGALLLALLSPGLRRDIVERFPRFRSSPAVAPRGVPSPFRHTGFVFLGNQALGAASNVLQNVAVFLAPASLVAAVPALQGVEYLAVILITAFLAAHAPQVLAESYGRGTLAVKIGAAVAIAVGIALVSLSP